MYHTWPMYLLFLSLLYSAITISLYNNTTCDLNTPSDQKQLWIQWLIMFVHLLIAATDHHFSGNFEIFLFITFVWVSTEIRQEYYTYASYNIMYLHVFAFGAKHQEQHRACKK